MSMTQQEMLDAMGIGLDDFNAYLVAYNTFFGKLTAKQKAFHLQKHQRTLLQIAQSLGKAPNGDQATPDDVQQLFDGAVQPAAPGTPTANMVASISCCKNG
jgi:hypothetical protein